MTQTNNGGPAFPIACCDRVLRHGMSLRDYFAGQALAGMLADTSRSGSVEHYVDDAYSIADAMLAERQKERE